MSGAGGCRKPPSADPAPAKVGRPARSQIWRGRNQERDIHGEPSELMALTRQLIWRPQVLRASAVPSSILPCG
jgi:hypothetical protein